MSRDGAGILGILALVLIGFGGLLLAADLQELWETRSKAAAPYVSLLPALLGRVPLVFIGIVVAVILLSLLAVTTAVALSFWPLLLIGIALIILFWSK